MSLAPIGFIGSSARRTLCTYVWIIKIRVIVIAIDTAIARVVRCTLISFRPIQPINRVTAIARIARCTLISFNPMHLLGLVQDHRCSLPHAVTAFDMTQAPTRLASSAPLTRMPSVATLLAPPVLPTASVSRALALVSATAGTASLAPAAVCLAHQVFRCI